MKDAIYIINLWLHVQVNVLYDQYIIAGLSFLVLCCGIIPFQYGKRCFLEVLQASIKKNKINLFNGAYNKKICYLCYALLIYSLLCWPILLLIHKY